MGLNEWPLMLFTVLGQISVGAFLVAGMALLGGRLEAIEKQTLLKKMFFIWVLLGVGFLGSAFHLGSPLRGLNAFSRIGHSGLSTEAFCGVLFFVIGGFYWLLAVLGKIQGGLAKAWLFVAMVLGVVFVYTMVQAYAINTVPTWDNGYTLVNFFMTMLVGGSLLGYWLKRESCDCGRGVLAFIAVAAFVASLGSNLLQGSELATITSSVISASQLSPDFGFFMTLRLVLIALGLALWLAPMMSGKQAGASRMMVALLLVIAGELVGRGVFYGLHMTVGMVYGG